MDLSKYDSIRDARLPSTNAQLEEYVRTLTRINSSIPVSAQIISSLQEVFVEVEQNVTAHTKKSIANMRLTYIGCDKLENDAFHGLQQPVLLYVHTERSYHFCAAAVTLSDTSKRRSLTRNQTYKPLPLLISQFSATPGFCTT